MSLWPPAAVDLAVVATGVSASTWDIRTRRIPNAITLGSAAVALAFSALAAETLRGALTAMLWTASGWAVGLLLFLPVFALRGLGGGDVKLLAAVGAWVGPAAVCWTALYASVAGGVMAVPLLIARGALGRTLVNIVGLLTFWRVAGIRTHPALTLESADAIRLPYALPITVGALLTLWWKT